MSLKMTISEGRAGVDLSASFKYAAEPLISSTLRLKLLQASDRNLPSVPLPQEQVAMLEEPVSEPRGDCSAGR